ncbi:yqaJ-like viral recombinase domain-containing protein [Phthorimaea operculella]|nr:yqaJ-like viral recombinase domain-containing protein [Phthorimaea operculella]
MYFCFRVVLGAIENVDQCDLYDQENHEVSPALVIEPELQPDEDELLVGRRLVDVDYLFKQLQDISEHGPLGCNLKCLRIASEFRKGLDSNLTFKCSMCALKFDVSLVQKEETGMNVNQQIVSGVMSCGSGHSHLQTITAAVALPGISPEFYSSVHDQVCDWWETAAAHCMSEAVKEEAEYAMSVGNVNKDGVPLIPVSVDGCWSKRSYGKGYSALSGAAAIIGLKFGKVLFFGIKNKYCVVCARAAKNTEPPEHTCFKNYSGPSTGMESTILVEGFKRSLPDHGVIYNQFVADGDSSTYKKILDSRPYGDLIVEKIECKNHLFRNFCNALVKLSQDTKFPPELRKFLKERYMRLRTGVNYAIKHWSSRNLPFKQKISNLSADVLNGPQHVFGNHENCKDYFCVPEKRKPEPIGLMAQLDSSGLMKAIENISKKLSYQSRSLIHDCTSNLVESYNAQVAKYIGGKRVNYSQRRSYAGRCAAAVVAFNTGTLHTTTHKVVFGTEPNRLIAKLEKFRKRKVEKAKQTPPTFKKREVVVSKDAHYGENCQQPDMSPDEYEDRKISFLNELRLSSDERQELERSTVLQRHSTEWMTRRRKLLTSSVFGEVCKKRESTSCASLVKKIIYGGNLSTVPAIRYGIDNEETAIRQLEKQENIQIESCGLFVDREYEFLGTTPDGKYADGLVEIKCPVSLAKFSLENAMKKHPFWKLDSTSKTYLVNEQHHWYYQIQGQLHITQKDVCMLGIWFGETVPMKVYLIQRDDKFWKTKMETKLVKFYYDCMLPELVDPRHSRSMSIRDPPYIIKAMEERKARVQSTSKNLEPNVTNK